MKKFRIIAVLAIAFCFLLGTTSVYGEEGPYQHRLTVSGGNAGSIENFDGDAGTSEVSIKTGETATLTVGDETYTVKPKDEKYFVKGLKLAGHDNNDVDSDVAGPYAGPVGVELEGSLVYGEDAEMVVAYGLKSSMVKYTVSYLDAGGAELLPSVTHYGVVGDRPIVSCKFIDGYLPNAYNAVKTLKEDESLNVITFTYTPVQAAEGNTIINNAGNANAAAGNAAAGNAAAGNAAAGNAAAGNAAAGNAAGNAGTAIGDNATPLAINDQDTPLANADQEEKEGGSPLMYIIGGVVVAAAIAAAIAAFLARRRATEEE